MDHPERHLITAALPYANGPLHIGHIAGAYLPADIYVRYLRLKGEDVAFICGSDEHGAAITLRAKKEGISPQEIVDKYHFMNQKGFKEFGIDFDIFHRTSSPVHHRTASEFFLSLYKKNKLIEKKTRQFYDEEHQQFLADRYIMGTCPKCDYDSAYGDQCERCGSSLNPAELINPISVLSGKKPVLKETRHWYLPMNEYETWLREWILEKHKKDWKPNVYGQCKSWIEAGLQPRAMTRDLDWGVKVPLEGAEGKVLYVWLDAPIGYISATKDWAYEKGKSWEDYWKNETTRLVHFIGKDNIVFHAIIFPILLKAHGGYILPDNVPANEFLNLEGDKISTSRNWAVWLNEYLQDFPEKQDELRYVLCSIAPETKDSEFTWKDYQARVNNELVAILANFVNRTLVLTHKYYEGKVPDLIPFYKGQAEKQTTLIRELKESIATSLDNYRFREGLAGFMELARYGNRFLTEHEPWKLIKEDEEKTRYVLSVSLQIVANLAILARPFLPFMASRLADMLNLEKDKVSWSDAGSSADLLPPGHTIEPAEHLFKKIEDDIIHTQILKLEQNKKSKTKPEIKPMKPEISFEDFAKLDLRTGTIINAEKVEKADKLLKITVDTGLDERTVVSGIAEYYSPEEIIGQKVTVLLNLTPRKIRGVESQGMILMAEDPEGKLAFVLPQKDMGDGSEVR